MRSPPLILVVDDSPSDALLLSRSLSKSGFAVAVAHDGDETIQVAAAQSPDLILLDMTMPGKDGIATCHILKEQSRTAQIPVIFVTAHSDIEHIVKAFAAGGSDYVTKPMRMDEILARVSLHLRLRAAEENLVDRNTELESLSRQLAESNEQLARQSRTDALTGLLNRRAWEQAAQVEHDRSARYGHSYGILMLDVDYFKLLNDSLGHRAGDDGLRRIGPTIGGACRSADIVGRYGGEEFVVLSPETQYEGAAVLAERIRQDIWNLCILHPASPAGRVTVSIGVAESDGSPIEEVVHRADAALYTAKRAGRNLVYGSKSGAPGWVSSPNAGKAADSGDRKSSNCPVVTVLIAEDDPGSRKVCRSSLGPDDYRIIEVTNGREAVTSAVEQAPDVIIMDLVMPVLGGLDAIRSLKSDPRTRDIPVIIISAKDGPAEILAGFEAGADEYLTKPLHATALAARVRSMVRWSRQRKELLQSYCQRSDQIRVLSALVDACHSIGTAASVRDVLECACETVAEVTGSRRVSAMLPDADRHFLSVAHAIGIEEGLAASIKVPVGEAVAGKVFESGKSIMVNAEADKMHSQPYYDSDFFVSVPFVSAPFGTGGEVLGVLNATERLDGAPFEDRELEYVTLIADIAGSAIQTLLHRKARDDARDLIVVALAKLAEHRDNETARHVERVTIYTRVIAESLRRMERFRGVIDDSFVDHLARAVPLHDIGKVAIPDSILRKPGRLSRSEMEVMRTHTNIGAETIRSVIAKVRGVPFLEMALEVIQSHHEWYDGTGYPHGLKGQAIPLSARVVAVADVYDALTTHRVYKGAISHEEAVKTIADLGGKQFDPDVVLAFMECKDEFKRLAAELADSTSDRKKPSPDLPRSRSFQETFAGP